MIVIKHGYIKLKLVEVIMPKTKHTQWHGGIYIVFNKKSVVNGEKITMGSKKYKNKIDNSKCHKRFIL